MRKQNMCKFLQTCFLLASVLVHGQDCGKCMRLVLECYNTECDSRKFMVVGADEPT